ncbi:BLUF domain-containing protein [Brevundimonas subvibrioides]|uniref:BLUF domain protein n=1 Tax=Brevundimonas subvibrioides (strain ATCC 15264 / DSM 4735 / LMG 14903 / NBRC 16000 / CB 81) TaxID=633149 RepID=D9QHQ8_BRESC|nr:BLUF domain-containing protein [Brevundimonas subvibrioides]ADK99333.1 BLUF domain protein [Brevundimonas subvibrioides ATCC 15264]
MLYRLIYISEAVGSTGASTLSIAQILGISERNNRRDHITSGVMFHDGWCLHAIEGARVDIDRLMRRLREDRRHTNIRVLVDKPIAERRFCEPMGLCHDPLAMLRMIGSPEMASITGYEAERIVDIRLAA